MNSYNEGSGLVSIEATSVSTDSLYCDDITSFSGIINMNISTLSNLNALFTRDNVTSAKNIYGSNLHTSNLIVYRGSNVLDTDAKIDFQKWIKNAPINTNSNGDLIILPPVAVVIYTSIINNIVNSTGGDGDENYDPDTNDSNVFVHWRNVIYHPFYCTRNGADEQVAFGSNVFIEKNSKIYGVDKVDLIKTDAGRTRRLDSNLLNPVVFYDFSNQELFTKITNTSNLNCSNLTSSNATIQNISATSITAPIITTSNLETVNLVGSNLNAFNLSSSNVSSSNIYSSNLSTRDLYAINAQFSNLFVLSNINSININSSNITTSNINSSNINSSNIYASNIDTRKFSSSNITACNTFSEFISATNLSGTTANINTLYGQQVFASNVSACNIKDLSNNYHAFSNASFSFNGSNMYSKYEKAVLIGKSDRTSATAKLEVEGNIKCEGLYVGSNLVINQYGQYINPLDTINIQRFGDGVLQTVAVMQEPPDATDVFYFANPFYQIF